MFIATAREPAAVSTRAPAAAATSAVPSVLPASTTITSPGSSVERAEAIAAPTRSASCQVGMTTEMITGARRR
jgi:hypothetical protein